MGHVCARCPKALGVSCCEVPNGEQLATLTWADVDRLMAATGKSVEALTEFEWLGEEQAARWARLHPTLGSYFGPVTRRLTLKRVAGACVLHGPKGCSVDAEARPTACRLYPFEVRAHGEWGLQVDQFGSVEAARASGEHACLAVEESDGFEALREKFGVTRESLEALSARQADEARAHRRKEQALHSEDPR
jgi:Fe-S-cluster containining protein